MPDWSWVAANADRIGAYLLLMVAVWALVTGRLVTQGRLDDHKELIGLLREENKQLRAAVEESNESREAVVRQMADINKVLERLADELHIPRRGRQA